MIQFRTEHTLVVLPKSKSVITGLQMKLVHLAKLLVTKDYVYSPNYHNILSLNMKNMFCYTVRDMILLEKCCLETYLECVQAFTNLKIRKDLIILKILMALSLKMTLDSTIISLYLSISLSLSKFVHLNC